MDGPDGPLTMRNYWEQIRGTRLVRYGIAILAVAAALGLRMLLSSFVRLESPFLLLFAAVMLASVYGGFGPGALAAAVGAIASSYLFLPPNTTGGIVSGDRAQVGLFFLEGVVLSLLGAKLLRERHRFETADAAARRLEQNILEISEDERRRIGHDLHDGLGQHLTGIALLSKALHQRLAAQQLPDSQQAEQIAELISKSIGWTRDLARGLSPVTIDADGLPSAMEELTTSVSKLLGITCRCNCRDEVPLDGETSLHLYRIAQEAINNSVKHGKASQIEVGLNADPDAVRLTVLDNGSGLSEKTRSHPGLGLQIMQYRAKMIDATLSIVRQKSEGGTLVTCVVPVPRRRSANWTNHESAHNKSIGSPVPRPAGGRSPDRAPGSG